MSKIPWESLKLAGELAWDPETLRNYSEDASIHRRLPAAVAFPKGKADLEAILSFCRIHDVTIHGWGAGTSRGGQPLGDGLIVNFREHWHQIKGYDEATGEVTVEPGVYYSEVQKFLKARGRSFPPDPSYHQCTIAGMVANNAAGIHSVKYGGTIEHVAAIEFLTPDGAWHHTDRPDALSDAVGTFLREHQAVIESDYPDVEKNSAGYALNRGLKADGSVDMPKLLTGSEGTLGLISELRLGTVPIPSATALGILYFDTLELALQASLDLRTYDIAACELVDKVLLDLHAQNAHGHGTDGPRHAKKISANSFLELFYTLSSDAVLIVEMEGSNSEEARASLEIALSSIQSAREKRFATSAEETALIWDLRRHTSPILNRLEDGRITIKPLWAVEDVSLPRRNFLAYVREQKSLFEKHGLTCSFFGHSASCNLHIDPIAVDPRKAREDDTVARLYDLVAEESYALTIKYGGSIAGEHGDGFTRTPFLPLQYPRAHKLFPLFKNLFDTKSLLNPGKVVPDPRRRSYV